MISTVTTSTVSTVSTVVSSSSSTVAGASVVAALSAAALLTLIAFLSVREMAVAAPGVRLRVLGRNLDLTVYPLLFVFAFVFFYRIISALP